MEVVESCDFGNGGENWCRAHNSQCMSLSGFCEEFIKELKIFFDFHSKLEAAGCTRDPGHVGPCNGFECDSHV